MRILYQMHSGCGVVEATRDELRAYFPENVVDHLEEGPSAYAFGCWTITFPVTGDSGIKTHCPVMTAFGDDAETFTDLALCRAMSAYDEAMSELAYNEEVVP